MVALCLIAAGGEGQIGIEENFLGREENFLGTVYLQAGYFYTAGEIKFGKSVFANHAAKSVACNLFPLWAAYGILFSAIRLIRSFFKHGNRGGKAFLEGRPVLSRRISPCCEN